MSESAIIYTAIVAVFILLIVIIRYFSGYRLQHNNQTMMYYKLDVKRREITRITAAVFGDETRELSRKQYELIFLSDISAFMNQQKALPLHSFIIALNDTYYNTLKAALPHLIRANISIIIFLPILVPSTNKDQQEKQAHRLSAFVFSEEFQNIFKHPLNPEALNN